MTRALHFSQERFGEAASERYYSLLLRAFKLMVDEPFDSRSRTADAVSPGLRTLHLKRLVRPGEQPRAPRHLLLYRIDGSTVRVIRILHDSMDLTRHLPAASKKGRQAPK